MRNPIRGLLGGVLLLWAISACGGGGGCNGCGASSSYTYPRTVPGKEPVKNAAQVRINQAGLDFVAGHLTDVLSSACCDPKKQSVQGETAAETCYGKAPCFLDELDLGGGQKV